MAGGLLVAEEIVVAKCACGDLGRRGRLECARRVRVSHVLDLFVWRTWTLRRLVHNVLEGGEVQQPAATGTQAEGSLGVRLRSTVNSVCT